jgi:hypothetical protein
LKVSFQIPSKFARNKHNDGREFRSITTKIQWKKKEGRKEGRYGMRWNDMLKMNEETEFKG